MSNFMYLFRGGQEMSVLSPEEMQAHMGKWMSWMGGLKEKGQMLDGLPLSPDGGVVTKGVVTDGPFTEGKEVVGGYLIVTASDLNEASDIANTCPIVEEGGSVEVREIMSLPEPVEN